MDIQCILLEVYGDSSLADNKALYFVCIACNYLVKSINNYSYCLESSWICSVEERFAAKTLQHGSTFLPKNVTRL